MALDQYLMARVPKSLGDDAGIFAPTYQGINGRIPPGIRPFAGKTVKCRTLVIPASRSVMLEAVDSGIASILLKAGASICNPGCGPCLGGHMGVLAEGESCMSTTNRNFKGRMGKNASVYLGSPLTAAATAVEGKIADPRRYL